MSRIRLGSTPDGRRVEVSRVVDAPARRVWSLLVDTGRWSEWGPSVRAVECVEREIHPGSTGYVVTPVGLRIPFEVVECDPFRWTWRVARVPATGHRVEPLDDGCRVVFEVPVFAAPYVGVCEIALRRIERLVRNPD